MAQLDERFLTIHPATAKWWEQREKCKTCMHFLEMTSHATVCKAVRHTKHKEGIVEYLPCIDARLPGRPCGPKATLFTPKS